MSSEQRKVLEDIQRAKRLLKEGAAVSLGIHSPTTSTPPMLTTASPAFPSQAAAGIGDMMMSPGMRSAMQVLSQANLTSFGCFIPQDSHFGNSILPVLPRIEPVVPTTQNPPTGSSTSTITTTAIIGGGNGQ
ncbi:SOSS complex subunit C [Orchesella cincta]|uniref:SOSS complex subunit C n=1 Tax=Orchesella cincta TaxID=48709 RepID=A0A1D2N921_ORCCI|nr:SOSS complex subunit C [Orchesella cincta]